MPNDDSNKVDQKADVAAKAKADAKAVKPDPYAGLIKMQMDGKIIHANPALVKEFEKSGWKTA